MKNARATCASTQMKIFVPNKDYVTVEFSFISEKRVSIRLCNMQQSMRGKAI